MNKDVRIQKIQEIVERDKNRDDLLREAIMWDGDLRPFPVFNIPLIYLVYNKYNGRILSRTKSLEKQNKLIDIETDEGRSTVEKLLWDSKIDRNKKTFEDIKTYGQKKIGIITRDGVIIDGNRRAMLLNRNDRTSTFKTIVLPVTLEENPIEIERLETTYQMGEDEKLGYNPIEKYLKAKQIYDKLISNISHKEAIKSISDWMGELPSEVQKYLETMAVMDEYLEYLEYDGIYTQLDSREDQFLFLTKWLNNFYDKESNKAFDGYNNDDVDDLKAIAFDYLRFRNKYDGKEFRILAEGQRDKHLFGDRDIWSSFSRRHNEILNQLPEEPEIDLNSNHIEAHLNERDDLFYEVSTFGEETSAFIDNLNEHKTKIEYNKAAEAPEKLVKRASQAFGAIKQGHKSFSSPEVQDLVKGLGNQIFSSLQKKSPAKVLEHIIELLENIDTEDIPASEVEEVLQQTKKIQKIGYEIHRSL